MKKILLDCDPGMDDSMAIVLATKSKAIELLAVTTVNGNYPVDVTCVNALKILELVQKTHIPVGKGMGKPLVRTSPKDPFTHGKDGQAEMFLQTPVTALSPLHGVDLMIETVKAHPNEVTIVVTGPMTNLAMAILKAPEIVPLIPQIVAISGTFGLNPYAYANATGDTPQSEWNVFVDPEAADMVYRSGIPLTALGLDVATHFDVNFSSADLRLLEQSNRPEASFLRNAIGFVEGRGYDAYCTVIDCLAVAYTIDPTLVETFTGRVGIETKDGLTLGMTVLDSRHHHAWAHLPQITIGKTADYGRFLQLLLKLVLE